MIRVRARRYGVFDDNRYFDVEVEHAKAGPEDILCRITVHNRSPQDAGLYVLPTLWFRNTWSWGDRDPKPRIARVPGPGRRIRSPGPNTTSSAFFYLYAQPESDPAVLRERDERGAGPLRRADHALSQGRHRRPYPARRRHCQSRW
jgi:hypothetical protein